MAAAALVVSVLALLVAGVGALFTRTNATAQRASARIQGEEAHLRRTPVLELAFDSGTWDREAVYRVTNRGPVDLTSVVVHRPDVPSLVFYPVARLGGDFDHMAPLGQLQVKQSALFILSIDSGAPTEMGVRIACSGEGEEWSLYEPLPIRGGD